jgi:hypothetical protein
MQIPELPADFYPNEPEEERISRWLVLEEEAAEMQRRDMEPYEEPQPPRLPFWMRDCCNESALRNWGWY